MGGEASGSNSGDDARGTQKQRGRNNAGYGDALGGGSTGSGNGNITPAPAPTPSGSDTLPGRAGNDKLGTTPTAAPTPAAPGEFAGAGRRSASPRGAATTSLLGGVDTTEPGAAPGTKLGSPSASRADRAKTDSSAAQRAAQAGKDALGLGPMTPDEINKANQFSAGLNRAEGKVGNVGTGTVTPVEEGLIGRSSKGVGVQDGRPGVSTRTQVGNLEAGGGVLAAFGLPGLSLVGKAADMKFNNPAGKQQYDSFEPTDKPKTTTDLSDAFGGDNQVPLPTTLPRNPNTTPGVTSKSATEPLTFLQRLTRQRGRAASTSVSGGQGNIASKTLLGG
jgi:hypothetical protein